MAIINKLSFSKAKFALLSFIVFSPVNELKRILQSLVICVHKILLYTFLTIYFYYSDLPHTTSFLPWGHVPFYKERLRLCVCVCVLARCITRYIITWMLHQIFMYSYKSIYSIDNYPPLPMTFFVCYLAVLIFPTPLVDFQ